MLAVQITPLDTLALHYLLVMHLLQNVVLAEWGPLLVVVGLTPAMARELERIPGARTLTHPLSRCPPGSAHTTSGTCRGRTTQRSGTSGRSSTSSTRRTSSPAACSGGRSSRAGRSSGEKAVYLFAAFVLASPLGLLLALLPHPRLPLLRPTCRGSGACRR
jgi:hypothetical protein